MLLAGGTSSEAPAPAATGPVEVALPPAPPEAADLCARVVAALPQTVGEGLARRPVTGEATRAAAWGDPAVTLGCGTAPADPTAEQVQLGPPEGGLVTFAVDDVGAATAFTTVGVPVPVTVTVPDAYDSQLLVPLSGVLLREGAGSP